MRNYRIACFVALALAAGCAAAGTPNVPQPGAPQGAAISRAPRIETPTPTLTPTPRPKPTPTKKPTPKPTPTKSPKPVLTAAEIEAALEGAEAYYNRLPHKNLVTDLEALASHMVASKQFASAAFTPGGVTATLIDGSPAFVFAGNREDRSAASETATPDGVTDAGPAALSGATQHEVAFLVNESDPKAFVPARQAAFAKAFVNAGFPKAGNNVDVLDVSLGNIAALGRNHPLDFLDIATHGAVSGPVPKFGHPGNFYIFVSTTPVTQASLVAFATEKDTGRLIPGIVVGKGKPVWAFTPEYLTGQLVFNPGAIVDNETCLGQSPYVAASVQATLEAAGVGRYFGWTKEVDGRDADESDAFVFDRMLGEQRPSVTGLNAYASQRVPAQRPFPLDAIETVMDTELRNSPINCTKKFVYAVSRCSTPVDNLKYPPAGDGYTSRLVFTDLGGENVAAPPIEYALPSINYLFTSFNYSGISAANNLLTVYGTFPEVRGTVEIKNPLGTQRLPVISWKLCHLPDCLAAGTVEIVAQLPDTGPGSYGLVTVRSAAAPGFAAGIGGNAVPLTEWSGSANVTDNETITDLDDQSGNGTGRATASFAFRVRADVQPAVQQIDTKPLPLNFTFDGIAAGSTGTLTRASGSFAVGKNQKATFTLGPQTTITTGKQGNHLGSYEMNTVAWTGKSGAPPCSTSIVPGPLATVPAGACAFFGVHFIDGLACTDNYGGFTCGTSVGGWSTGFAFAIVNPGPPPIVLTLDRKTYAIAALVKNPPPGDPTLASFYQPQGLRNGDPGSGTSTRTLTGLTFGAPLSPP